LGVRRLAEGRSPQVSIQSTSRNEATRAPQVAAAGGPAEQNTIMKIRSIFAAAYAAVAIATATPAAAHGVGETVSPHFEHAITNIAGKSLVALIVDYAPGG